MNDIAIACDLNALTPDQRVRHAALAEELFASTQETRVLADGYALRLANHPDTWLKAAEFVSFERLCCPFINFRLELEAGSGDLWLSLTGREGVKEFLAQELAGVLRLNARIE